MLRRFAARFAGSAQIWWACAAITFVVAMYMARNVQVVSISFDRTAAAYDVTSAWHPSRRSGRTTTDAYSEIHYRFIDDTGAEHAGISYLDTTTKDSDHTLVEYRSSDPSTSRLAGTSTRSGSALNLLIVLIPIILVIAALFDASRARPPPAPSATVLYFLVLPTMSVVLMVATFVVVFWPR